MLGIKVTINEIINKKLNTCILGGAIGDAFGSSYENQKVDCNNLTIENSKWELTDDTQLTIATYESIINSLEINPNFISINFVRWFNEKKINRTGASTLKALQELQFGGHWSLTGRRGEFAAGNGAAMRIAPLAFFVNTNDFYHKQILRDVCDITHNNDEAYSSCLAIILAIQYFLKTRKIEKKKYFNYIISNLSDSITKDNLIKLSSELTLDIKAVAKKYGNSAYAPQSIPFAIFCASKYNNENMSSIFKEIICSGGDTDTNCSLAGQIIGSSINLNSFPKELIEKLKTVPNFHLISNLIYF